MRRETSKFPVSGIFMTKVFVSMGLNKYAGTLCFEKHYFSKDGSFFLTPPETDGEWIDVTLK